MNNYDTETWPVVNTHGTYDVGAKYTEAIQIAAKHLAERIDRECLEQIERDSHFKIKFLAKAKEFPQWTTFSFNVPDPRTVTTIVASTDGVTITHTGIFEELDEFKEAQVLNPKLQRTLERNYELARCKHDVKLMRRLEKQMNANNK